jgi:hypothetical protein
MTERKVGDMYEILKQIKAATDFLILHSEELDGKEYEVQIVRKK